MFVAYAIAITALLAAVGVTAVLVQHGTASGVEQ